MTRNELWLEYVEKCATVPNSSGHIYKMDEIVKCVGREGFKNVKVEDVEDLLRGPLQVQELKAPNFGEEDKLNALSIITPASRFYASRLFIVDIKICNTV